jgi:hypothetical protein
MDSAAYVMKTNSHLVEGDHKAFLGPHALRMW